MADGIEQDKNRMGASLRIVPIILIIGSLLINCTGGNGPEDRTRTNDTVELTPMEKVIRGQYDMDQMTQTEMAQAGEIIIFGRLTGGNPTLADVGKGLCPMCHTVTGPAIRDAAPDLTANDKQTGQAIGVRGTSRIKDPRYLKGDFIQKEAFPGSGRALSALEYLAESHVCPSCFVVEGFGKKGSNDRESPMIAMHLPPNCQTIEEVIMIDTYLYLKDGLEPPQPNEIRTAYEKFLPDSGRSAAC